MGKLDVLFPLCTFFVTAITFKGLSSRKREQTCVESRGEQGRVMGKLSEAQMVQLKITKVSLSSALLETICFPDIWAKHKYIITTAEVSLRTYDLH